MNFVISPPLAYFARYIPANVPIGTVISNDKNTRYIVLKSWLPIAPRLVKPNIEGFAPAKPLIITYPANAARSTKKNTAIQ